MGSSWVETPIGDIARVRSGYAFKSADWVDHGTPVVKIANVKEGRLEMDGASLVDEVVASKAREFELAAGDILIAMTGYVGDTALVTERDLPLLLNQRVGKFFVRDSTRLDSRFLFYVLRQPSIREEIKSRGYGSAQPNVSPSLIEGVGIPLPPLDEQRRIAHIIGTLDDKIELNRRMNETLEEMARALFKSWFVDFDPVRAKSEGRDPGLPKHLADLFPDRLVDSELGEIPEGWELLPVDDEFRVTIGRTPPRKEAHWFSKEATDVPWVSIRDMGQAGTHVHDVAEYLTHDAVSTHRVEVVPAGTVLLSFKLTVGRVSVASRPLATNEAIAHFHPRSADSVGGLYLYSYLKQFDYGTLGNTSSIATAVNSKSVRAMPLLRPSAEVAGAFARESLPLFAKLESLDAETRTLADSRDALLKVLLIPNRQVNASGGQDDRSG